MDALVNYFADIPSTHRAAILIGGIAFFWIAENAWPAFTFDYKKWPHALVNFFYTLTTIVINFALAFLLLMASEFATQREFGLLFLIDGWPLWVQTLLALMVLDGISAWLPHLIEHKTPMLWKLHLIHHSDRFVDTTTANRHHPGESVVRFTFTALAIILVGAPLWLVFCYQAISVVFAQLTHANISLPTWLDRGLSYVLVSPDMHKVHHHYQMPITDSNYGNIFSVWDRLFGTFKTFERSQIVYGIDTHMDPVEHTTIGALFLMPFRPKPSARKPKAE